MFKRRAEITVENHTNVRWTAINAIFRSGTSETCLPDEVTPNGALKFVAVQRPFSIFTGTCGAFTYSIPNGSGEPWKTLAVMWVVPFDYNLWRSNYWNVMVLDGKQVPASRELFKKMWKRIGEPLKGQDDWKETRKEISTEDWSVTRSEFISKGCMTSNSNSKLIIKVYNNRDHQ